MNNQTLAKGLYFPLFGKRETMQEAFDYDKGLFEGLV